MKKTKAVSSAPPEWAKVLKLIPGYDCYAGAGDYWFDPEAADQHCDFFTECLKHIEGAVAGKPFVLEPWQRAIVGCMFGWKRKSDNLRRYREVFVYVPRKNGKALALTTKIPTPSGWTTMGEIAAGDTVFDESGAPCRVLEAHPIMHGHECYEVGFSDGTKIVADAEHLWTVRDLSNNRDVTITTYDIGINFQRPYLLPAPPFLESADHKLNSYLPRQITSFFPVKSVPVRCIRVDSDSHLFLAGEGMVPTHNTPLAAGLLNDILFCDGESGAQCFSAAADKDQAALLYRHASGMVRMEPELDRRARIYAANKAMVLKADQASSYRVLSSEADTKHGGNPHFVIVDELHALPNRDLVDVLKTGFASENRKQPIMMYITTADYEREGSICNELHDYASKVRDGVIQNPLFLPVIYETKPDEDWKSPEVWRKANPNLGISVSLEYFASECKRAQDVPTYENTFKRLHLNMKTQQDVRWLPLDKWDACAAVPGVLNGQPCFGGLDLASTGDITALVLYFPYSGSVLPFFWVPEEGAHERERRDRAPYVTWIRGGFMRSTPGNVADYDFIRRDIVELGKQYQIKEIAFDRWNARQITTQLQGDDFNMVEFGQGFASMTAPSKELERLILKRALCHGGHPVLRWMVSNCAAEIDAAGNIKPSKKKSSEKIDGVVGLVMAIGRAIGSAPDDNVYASRGLVVLG